MEIGQNETEIENHAIKVGTLYLVRNPSSISPSLP
jgi:hypothetical protein